MRADAAIQGERFRLRPLRKEDLPRRLEMINDPGVQRLWIGLPADKNDLDALEMWFYMVSEDPYSEQWAVETLDGRYVGDIDLHSIDASRREAWLSPMIGDPIAWDRESRRDILVTVLRYALHDKDLHKISIQMPDSDREGVELLQELGFRIVDQAELDIFDGVNELTLELLATDFSP
ncbi:MAG: GNAT family N-acetyltransferase [Firmicutes bacterium]|nr:GNAT family N-acetyltransferase [Bacillota bacterium]